MRMDDEQSISRAHRAKTKVCVSRSSRLGGNVINIAANSLILLVRLALSGAPWPNCSCLTTHFDVMRPDSASNLRSIADGISFFSLYVFYFSFFFHVYSSLFFSSTFLAFFAFFFPSSFFLSSRQLSSRAYSRLLHFLPLPSSPPFLSLCSSTLVPP